MSNPAVDSGTVGTWGEVEAVASQFPEIPLEVVVKEDCLRRGLWFAPEALPGGPTYAGKSYFIFSFDHRPPSELEGPAREKAPEEIALQGGPFGFRRVVISVRLNPASPYLVALDEQGRRVLRFQDQKVAEVTFAPFPPYYGVSLRDGTPIIEVAPSIEWGYLLYLTVFRICQYFGQEEECKFCDINRNFRQQRSLGRPYHAVKPVERVLEALKVIASSGAAAQAYTLTGGSITGSLEGLDEVAFYLRYAEAIEGQFPGRWLGKMVVQALPRPEVERIRAAGIRIYHPNYEVWDRELFGLLCPGKARLIGWETWVHRILEAAEVFGPAQVIPNFVAGIEMAAPWGFRSEEQAWRSTGEGLEFFMSRGIVPRFTTWCPEPLSVLGRNNGPASLRYHVGLLRTWRDLHAGHRLPAPPGYGPVGLGQAVFSVSSFMDVIDRNCRLAEIAG